MVKNFPNVEIYLSNKYQTVLYKTKLHLRTTFGISGVRIGDGSLYTCFFFIDEPKSPRCAWSGKQSLEEVHLSI